MILRYLMRMLIHSNVLSSTLPTRSSTIPGHTCA
nr:MAG TPA: hypothetical protein [Caudoviricetes sp.]